MLPIIRPLTGAERERIGRSWAKRAETERLNELRFQSLLQALRVHGTISTVLELCERASIDAQKHVSLCLKLAKDFGVDGSINQTMRPGPLAPAELMVDQKVLYEVVAVGCVQQTYQGALLGRMYQSSKWPPIRLNSNIMLEDKVWQGRMGWAHLGAAAQRLDITWLEPYLVIILRSAYENLISDPLTEDFSRDDYGQFSTTACSEIMREAITTVILPGFESFGLSIDACRKWVNELTN